MTCPEIHYGAATYYGGMAIGVGAVLRVVKRLLPDSPRTADMLPALAFVLGYAADFVCQLSWCGYDAKGAAVAALAGGLVGGLPAAGGHEMLVRSARLVGLESLAEWLLGRASKATSRIRLKGTVVLIAALAAPLMGCGGGFATVSAEAVSAAVDRNNDLVAVMQSAHDETRMQRQRVLFEIARTAPTMAAGEEAIDMTAKRYTKVFDLFQRAETLQHAIAEVLETAQQGIKLGHRPDLNSVVASLFELQQLYASIVKALAEVR